MRWPLRHQLLWPLVVVAGASLTALGALNGYLAGRQTRERIDRQLQGVVEVLSTTNFPLSDAVLRQMRDLSQAEFALTDTAEALLATSLPDAPSALPRGMTSAKLENSSLGTPIEIGEISYFHTVAELPPRGSAIEARQLHVLFPESEYRRSWREAFLPPLVVGAVALVAVVLVASFLARRFSRATGRLSTEVLRIARGDFTPAELPKTDDEIRDLSVAVNRTAEMLAVFEQQIRRAEQMRTVAMLGPGLAHEMRNAATGCRMALDIHAENCNAGGGKESLSVAKRQLRLMESQLQRFMRTGKPLDPGNRREVDLGAVIADLLPLVNPTARHSRIHIDYAASEPAVLVSADEEAMGQLVLNLILNSIQALQQSNRDALKRISIEVTSVGDRARLAISDTGPGLSDKLADAAFTPFVTTKPEGIGLGLTMAREIANAHGGDIRWTRVGDVTSFVVEIPLARRGMCCV